MADVARDVTIGMLGPLEVRVGFGEPVEVVGPRLRTLVIRLALDPDRVVLASQLIDAIWDEDPPAGATNAPGPPTPGPRSASTRRRPPARSSAAGSAATCRASSLAG